MIWVIPHMCMEELFFKTHFKMELLSGIVGIEGGKTQKSMITKIMIINEDRLW